MARLAKTLPFLPASLHVSSSVPVNIVCSPYVRSGRPSDLFNGDTGISWGCCASFAAPNSCSRTSPEIMPQAGESGLDHGSSKSFNTSVSEDMLDLPSLSCCCCGCWKPLPYDILPSTNVSDKERRRRSAASMIPVFWLSAAIRQSGRHNFVSLNSQLARRLLFRKLSRSC